MHIIIKKLNQCSQYAPILAHWSYFEWYQKRNINFDVVLKSYQKNTGNNALPTVLVAIADSFPVGMISLKENDLWSRKDLNPWMSSLYVLPDFRKLGIGGKLISEVLSISTSLSLEKIYLFLGQNNQDRLSNYYTEKNWKYLDDAVDNDGLPTKIYYYELLHNL